MKNSREKWATTIESDLMGFKNATSIYRLSTPCWADRWNWGQRSCSLGWCPQRQSWKETKGFVVVESSRGQTSVTYVSAKAKKPFRTLHCYNSRYEHLDWDTTDFALWDTAIYLHWHKIKMHASLCCIVCMLERARNSPCFQGKCEIVCISCLGSLSQELHQLLKNEEKTQSDKKHAWKRASNT